MMMGERIVYSKVLEMLREDLAQKHVAAVCRQVAGVHPSVRLDRDARFRRVETVGSSKILDDDDRRALAAHEERLKARLARKAQAEGGAP